jgi:hypothetical protein
MIEEMPVERRDSFLRRFKEELLKLPTRSTSKEMLVRS